MKNKPQIRKKSTSRIKAEAKAQAKQATKDVAKKAVKKGASEALKKLGYSSFGSLAQTVLLNPWTWLAVIIITLVWFITAFFLALLGPDFRPGDGLSIEDLYPGREYNILSGADIPEDIKLIYKNAHDEFKVPLEILIAWGDVATSHGRNSPYDCIARLDRYSPHLESIIKKANNNKNRGFLDSFTTKENIIKNFGHTNYNFDCRQTRGQVLVDGWVTHWCQDREGGYTHDPPIAPLNSYQTINSADAEDSDSPIIYKTKEKPTDIDNINCDNYSHPSLTWSSTSDGCGIFLLKPSKVNVSCRDLQNPVLSVEIASKAILEAYEEFTPQKKGINTRAKRNPRVHPEIKLSESSEDISIFIVQQSNIEGLQQSAVYHGQVFHNAFKSVSDESLVSVECPNYAETDIDGEKNSLTSNLLDFVTGADKKEKGENLIPHKASEWNYAVDEGWEIHKEGNYVGNPDGKEAVMNIENERRLLIDITQQFATHSDEKRHEENKGDDLAYPKIGKTKYRYQGISHRDIFVATVACYLTINGTYPFFDWRNADKNNKGISIGSTAATNYAKEISNISWMWNEWNSEKCLSEGITVDENLEYDNKFGYIDFSNFEGHFGTLFPRYIARNTFNVKNNLENLPIYEIDEGVVNIKNYQDDENNLCQIANISSRIDSEDSDDDTNNGYNSYIDTEHNYIEQEWASIAYQAWEVARIVRSDGWEDRSNITICIPRASGSLQLHNDLIKRNIGYCDDRDLNSKGCQFDIKTEKKLLSSSPFGGNNYVETTIDGVTTRVDDEFFLSVSKKYWEIKIIATLIPTESLCPFPSQSKLNNEIKLDLIATGLEKAEGKFGDETTMINEDGKEVKRREFMWKKVTYTYDNNVEFTEDPELKCIRDINSDKEYSCTFILKTITFGDDSNISIGVEEEDINFVVGSEWSGEISNKESKSGVATCDDPCYSSKHIWGTGGRVHTITNTCDVNHASVFFPYVDFNKCPEGSNTKCEIKNVLEIPYETPSTRKIWASEPKLISTCPDNTIVPILPSLSNPPIFNYAPHTWVPWVIHSEAIGQWSYKKWNTTKDLRRVLRGTIHLGSFLFDVVPIPYFSTARNLVRLGLSTTRGVITSVSESKSLISAVGTSIFHEFIGDPATNLVSGIFHISTGLVSALNPFPSTNYVGDPEGDWRIGDEIFSRGRWLSGGKDSVESEFVELKVDSITGNSTDYETYPSVSKRHRCGIEPKPNLNSDLYNEETKRTIVSCESIDEVKEIPHCNNSDEEFKGTIYIGLNEKIKLLNKIWTEENNFNDNFPSICLFTELDRIKKRTDGDSCLNIYTSKRTPNSILGGVELATCDYVCDPTQVRDYKKCDVKITNPPSSYSFTDSGLAILIYGDATKLAKIRELARFARLEYIQTNYGEIILK